MAFLDNFLSTFRRKRVPPTKRAGTIGTPVFGGFVEEKESNDALIGRKRYETFSNHIANVSIIGASIRLFLNTISRAEWRVLPPEEFAEDSQAIELAETVEDMMHDMFTPWHRIVRRAAMYRAYGFSIQEWTAKRRDDGTIGFLDIEPRPQLTIEKWDLEDSGQVLGVVQRSPQNGEELYLPRTKLIYLVDDSLNDSPQGLGLLRHSAETARQLMKYEQLEGFGYENDLRGVPIARVPISDLRQAVKNEEMTQSEMDASIKHIRDFMKKHIVNPSLSMMLDSKTYQATDDARTPSAQRKFDLELLGGDSQRNHADVDAAIRRRNREIARLWGTEHLLLGDAGTGSRSLGETKSNNFALIVDSTLGEITETMNKDFLDPIWRMNGWPKEMKPKFQTEKLNHRDVTEITQALKDLGTAGLLPNDPAENEVREMMGLSPIDREILIADSALISDSFLDPNNNPGTNETDDDVDDDANEEDK